ncbi:MAG: thiamine pyrophosphate-dependent dehydrogenase E1 component subunit alpha [Bdellovibrionales bacterium]|nr:thiamine pyrophosphate-dependent dehydrogenase E1 component subunit alpha [Bdellovibrionales bacterium]
MANISINEMGPKAPASKNSKSEVKGPSDLFQLSKKKLLKIHDLMLKSRVLEERLIKIYKAGEAYFWIGGPGEEAFGVPLGLLTKKGQGPEYDWLHLHYRCTPTLLSLGMSMIDSIRLIMNKATDPSTGGRNFSNHYCFPQWNVAPVTSPIEVQYSQALGTAWVQKRRNTDSVTIVTGGDAGSAEGDFASCLVWASRRGSELPILITVQNNLWGISTSYESQHGEEFIAHRGKAFGIKTMVINGNDPEESYIKLQEAFDYIRSERKPVLLEAMVSRLYGHSSASGANRVEEEDCLEIFEQKLIQAGYLTTEDIQKMRQAYELEAKNAQEQVRAEAPPSKDSIWEHFYANGENGDWRKF